MVPSTLSAPIRSSGLAAAPARVAAVVAMAGPERQRDRARPRLGAHHRRHLDRAGGGRELEQIAGDDAEPLGVARRDLGPSAPHHGGERVGQLLEPRLVGAATVAVLRRLEEEQRERVGRGARRRLARSGASECASVDSATMGVAAARAFPAASTRRRSRRAAPARRARESPRSRRRRARQRSFHACARIARARRCRPAPRRRGAPVTACSTIASNDSQGRSAWCARARSPARARRRRDDDSRRSA